MTPGPMRPLVALLSLVVLSLAARPATAQAPADSAEFDFRRVRWGMTDAQVRRSEPGRGEDTESGLLSYDVRVLERPATLYFTFTGPFLTSASYFFETDDTFGGDVDQGRALLADLVRVVESKYGPATSHTTASRSDLTLDTGRESSTWETDRARITAELYRGRDYEYRVSVTYDANDVDRYLRDAAQDLAQELFAPTESGRGDWRRLRWGARKADVVRARGRPDFTQQDGIREIVGYTSRVARMSAVEMLTFDPDGGLIGGALHFNGDSTPTQSDRALFEAAANAVFGPTTLWNGAVQVWRGDRSHVGLTLNGEGLSFSVLQANYTEAINDAAGRHADDF